MDKEKLNRLLDSIYELEGLVHLAIARDDVPEVLPGLIRKKGQEVCRMLEIEEDKVVPQEDSGKAADDNETGRVEDREPVPKPAPERTVADVEEKVETVNSEALRGKLVFSINDRYRFKRELFENSDIQFNTTLAMVAGMESYEEAESYFLDELGWDGESEEVNAFLDILKNYFKE